jgi:hypothetical protein
LIERLAALVGEAGVLAEARATIGALRATFVDRRWFVTLARSTGSVFEQLADGRTGTVVGRSHQATGADRHELTLGGSAALVVRELDAGSWDGVDRVHPAAAEAGQELGEGECVEDEV